jgi:predicted ATPase/class 3 adenylate cyclase
MPACGTCGHELTPDAKFCANCGSPVGEVAPAREVRKLVTVLFADVTGSTALGEQLDPETLRTLMARYFAMRRGVIERHGGSVEKIIGDAVMAVFGIPAVHEDDALRAVRAADEIRTELAALNTELSASRGLLIRFRTGVNSGEVVSGDPTTGATLVTGDTVNTAARLEQAAPPGEILLGALTYSLVRDAVEVEPIAPIAAKGKAELVPAYRLVAVRLGTAGRARRLDAPLVGRERELARLEGAFRGAIADGSCQLFTLLGAAGVGKSRLVAEFIAAVGSEALILSGRCLSYGEGITYWPIGEIVRAVAGIDEDDTAEAARTKVRALFGAERDADVLATRVAAAIGLAAEPAPQEELFWAIRTLLEHLARDRPLVVVVEDIHWAEPTLLDLLEHITDWSRDAPLLVLCPARPELLETRPGWGGGKLNATTVLLEPLPAEATGRLIEALPGGPVLPAEVVAGIQAAAEGNPLYVEELLAMLVDDGLLRQEPGGEWAAAPDIGEVRIPASITALLEARLERLEPAVRSVAERASVVGRIFERAAVSELADEALRPEVGRSLLALIRKELIRPDRSELTAGEAFKFRHILIRDAAYQALPKTERALLHERFARWLEQTAGDRLAEFEEILGYHLERAYAFRTELGETGEDVERLAMRAAERYLSSGRRSLDRGDMPAAANLLRAGVELLPAGHRSRLEALPDLGFAMFSAGALDDARSWLDRALQESKAAGEEVAAIRARLELHLLELLTTAKGADEIGRDAREAIRRLEELGDHTGLAKAWLVLAQIAWLGGRAAEAVAARDRALHYGQRGDRSRIRQVTFWGAEAYGPEHAETAVATLEAARSAAAGDPLAEAVVLFSLTGLYAMVERLDAAREARDRLRERLRELGMFVWLASSAEVSAVAEMVADELDAAESVLRTGIAELRRLGAEAYLASLLAMLAVTLARQGRSAEAIAAADESTQAAAEGDLLVHIFSSTARALGLSQLGDIEASVQAGRDAVRFAEKTDFLTFVADAQLALAKVLAAAGKDAEAGRAFARAIDTYHRKGNVPGEARARAAAGSVTAR